MNDGIESGAIERLRTSISELVVHSLQEHQDLSRATKASRSGASSTGVFRRSSSSLSSNHATGTHSATATPEESHATPGPGSTTDELLEISIKQAVESQTAKRRASMQRGSPKHELMRSDSGVELPVLPPLESSPPIQQQSQIGFTTLKNSEYTSPTSEQVGSSQSTPGFIPAATPPTSSSVDLDNVTSIKTMVNLVDRQKSDCEGTGRSGILYSISHTTPYQDDHYTALYRKYLERFSQSVPDESSEVFTRFDGSDAGRIETSSTPPASEALASHERSSNGDETNQLNDYNVNLNISSSFKSFLELEAAVAARGGRTAFEHFSDWLLPPNNMLPDCWGKPMSRLAAAACVADGTANRVIVSSGVQVSITSTDKEQDDTTIHQTSLSVETPGSQASQVSPDSHISQQPSIEATASPLTGQSNKSCIKSPNSKWVDPSCASRESTAPKIMVGFGSEWISISPPVLPYWEFAHFLPYSTPKQCRYVVLSPNFSGPLLQRTSEFMRDFCALFDVSGFGSMVPAAVFSDKGILNLDVALNEASVEHAQMDHGTKWRMLLESYVSSVSLLYQTLWKKKRPPKSNPDSSTINGDDNLVFFIIKPEHASVWTMHLLSALYEMLQNESNDGTAPFRVHLQVINMVDIVDVATRKETLQQHCVSVFTKLQPTNSEYTSTQFALCEPIIALDAFKTPQPAQEHNSDNSSDKDEGEIADDAPDKPDCENLVHSNLFHVCYSWSDCGCWLVMSWTDTQGVFLQTRCERILESPRFADANVGPTEAPSNSTADSGDTCNDANHYSTLYRNRQERHRQLRKASGHGSMVPNSPMPNSPPFIQSNQTISKVVDTVCMSPGIPIGSKQNLNDANLKHRKRKSSTHSSPRHSAAAAVSSNTTSVEQHDSSQYGSEVSLSRDEFDNVHRKLWEHTLLMLQEYLSLDHTLPDSIILCKLGNMTKKEAASWSSVLEFSESSDTAAEYSIPWGKLVKHPSSGQFGVKLTSTPIVVASAIAGSAFVPPCDGKVVIVADGTTSPQSNGTRSSSPKFANGTRATIGLVPELAASSSSSVIVSSTPLRHPAELVCATMHDRRTERRRKTRSISRGLPEQSAIPLPFMHVRTHAAGKVEYDHKKSKTVANIEVNSALHDGECQLQQKTSGGCEECGRVADEIVEQFERLAWVARSPFSKVPVSVVPLHIVAAAKLGLWLSSMGI